MDERFNICKINDVSTIKQKKYYYCAAACIKMALNLEDTQDEIFNELQNLTIDKQNWYADPDSVFYYLSKYNSLKRTSDFVSSSIQATENIISSLIKNENCYPMLISHGKHWVVYVGYQMNNSGTPTGIYIKDPWPTTTALSFFPFTDYFFTDYFNTISVEGPMKNKVETFLPSNSDNCVSLEIFKKPLAGGFTHQNISYFKKDILLNDLHSFGLRDINFPKSGGGLLNDITVYDINMQEKYFLSFLEINEELVISAIEIQSLLTIGFIYANMNHVDMFNKSLIAKKITGDENDIDFVYIEKYCNSCFTPLIKYGSKLYDLSLSTSYTYEE